MISLLIPAYNEERNIVPLLSRATQSRDVQEIIVVASGCTDRTVELAQGFRGVKVYTQEKREGKTSAINFGLQRTIADIVILQSADTLPGAFSYPHLLKPFERAEIGMTGGRPTPVSRKGVTGAMGALLWEAHHRLAMHSPKLGECIAFRRVFDRLQSEGASTDEASIEREITARNLKLQYCPDAVIFNQPPKTLSDLWKQRKRIAKGHKALKKAGYSVATNSLVRSGIATWQAASKTPQGLSALFLFAMIELAARMKARGPEETVWAIADSTKSLSSSSARSS